jgi:transcriptional regulator with XRE-family HTH domain
MALSSTQIKKALRARELNMAVIARRLKVSPTTVWKNVHKVKGGKSARVQEEIARSLEMDVEQVFGTAA